MTATEKRNWQMVKNAEMLELEEIIILINDTFKIHKGYAPSLLLEDDTREGENKKYWLLSEGETEWTGRAEKIKDCYLGFYEWLLDEVFQEQIYKEQDEQEHLLTLTSRQRAEWFQW